MFNRIFNRKNQAILLYFLMSLGIIILYNFDPADSTSIYPPSLSRQWGAFYCAGCGMTRALYHLVHGNWRTALRFNPLLIISLPYFFYLITPWFLKYFYKINSYPINYKNGQLIVFTIVCLFYGVLRNIPSSNLSNNWLVPPG